MASRIAGAWGFSAAGMTSGTSGLPAFRILYASLVEQTISPAA